MWLSGSQIPRIQACGLTGATAEAVGIAPGPGIDPGIDPGGVLRDGKMTAVAQRYTLGGIRPEIRSLFDNTFGEKRNF